MDAEQSQDKFSLDARNIHEAPDSYGLIYFHGTPITNVPMMVAPGQPYAPPRALAGMDIVPGLQLDDTPATALYPCETFRKTRACR
jgi:hypothetical protein